MCSLWLWLGEVFPEDCQRRTIEEKKQLIAQFTQALACRSKELRVEESKRLIDETNKRIALEREERECDVALQRVLESKRSVKEDCPKNHESEKKKAVIFAIVAICLVGDCVALSVANNRSNERIAYAKTYVDAISRNIRAINNPEIKDHGNPSLAEVVLSEDNFSEANNNIFSFRKYYPELSGGEQDQLDQYIMKMLGSSYDGLR